MLNTHINKHYGKRNSKPQCAININSIQIQSLNWESSTHRSLKSALYVNYNVFFLFLLM